jgi:tRNA(fMet)-specific endonuclease VapC
VKLLLDTNIYSALARAEQDVVRRAELAEGIYLSVISLGELRAGFIGGSLREQNERMFREFLDRPTANLLLIDEQTTETYGHLVNVLRRQGTPIPMNDVWIAAQAMQHDLTLDTRDAHFRHVPGLKLV